MVTDTAISLTVITNFSLSGWFLLFWEFIVSMEIKVPKIIYCSKLQFSFNTWFNFHIVLKAN